MFSSVFVSVLVLQCVSASLLRGFQVIEDVSEWSQYSDFIEKFGKKYESVEEMEVRFRVFRDNLRDIAIHNMNENRTFTMGVNQFTDMTASEFKTKFASGFMSTSLGAYGCKAFSSDASGAPSSIDWRSKGAVNPVRDQGQCGSCWAFASTANAESVWAISTGSLVDLSEQEIVDCASGKGYYNLGCNGGQEDSAFKYMINEGQCADAGYPYTATSGTCKKCDSIVHFSSCYDVAPNDQISLKGALAKNPVVIAIEADTRYFQSYSSGILTDAAKCGTNLDHAVEIVGYGSENGVDYWVVRNSWGASWGENGYVRLARSNSKNDPGVCGLAVQPSFIAV